MMSRYAKHLAGTGSGPLQQRRARSPCSHPTQFAHHMAESLLRFPCSPSRLKQCKVASDAIAAIVGLEALNLVHVSAGARGVLRLKRESAAGPAIEGVAFNGLASERGRTQKHDF